MSCAVEIHREICGSIVMSEDKAVALLVQRWPYSDRDEEGMGKPSVQTVVLVGRVNAKYRENRLVFLQRNSRIFHRVQCTESFPSN